MIKLGMGQKKRKWSRESLPFAEGAGGWRE